MSRDEGMVDVHFKVPATVRDALDAILPDGKMRSILLRRLVMSYITEFRKGEVPDAIAASVKTNVERVRKEVGNGTEGSTSGTT